MVDEFRARRDARRRRAQRDPGHRVRGPGRRVLRLPDGSAAPGLTGAAFADRLLDEAGVCVLAGTAFGRAGGDHVRISYADEPREPRRGDRADRRRSWRPRASTPRDRPAARLRHRGSSPTRASRALREACDAGPLGGRAAAAARRAAAPGRGRGRPARPAHRPRRRRAARRGRDPACGSCRNYAVGFDNVDVPACTRRGIAVGNTPGVLTETTADLAWTLLMAAARRHRRRRTATCATAAGSPGAR